MKFYISILIISLIICSPPPKPEPTYEIFVQTQKPVNYINDSSLKDLEENSASQIVEEMNVVVNILENGKYEEHELKIGTKNLPDEEFYREYKFYLILLEGQEFEIISNSCYKTLLSGANSTENNKCTFSLVEQINKITFIYNYKLFKDEYIIINYKFKIIKVTKEILFKQELVSIQKSDSGGKCNYKFILPDGYINLGLVNNSFTKESEKIYSYINDCPSNNIYEVIRFSPPESLWKADIDLSLELSIPITGETTFKFPRYYIGGKNTNENYKLISNDNKPLEESIDNEISFKVNIPGSNTDIFGINLNTEFSNKLSKEFSVYTNEDFYKINEDIDDVIKQKTQEIINNQSLEYKDYPNYYKIGKFVNSYIKYDLKYHGKNLTALQILNQKKGVCQHYTTLYNAMLNSIGIKTIKVFGWAFQKDETSANENTVGHAWTVALIDGKWKELDSTWGLFEGIPAGHILKGFNKERYSYSYSYQGNPGQIERNFKKTETIQLIDKFENLDTTENNTNNESGNNENNESDNNENNESDNNENRNNGNNKNINNTNNENGNKWNNESESENNTEFNIIRTSKAYNMKFSLLIYIIPIFCFLL